MSSSKKGQIESAKIVIGEVFSRFWFRIPDYQRAYVWGKDEISELIDDVNYASEHNPEGQYFLGSMVLRKATRTTDGVSFEEYELLDGQQRLQSLFIGLRGSHEGRELYFDVLSGGVAAAGTAGRATGRAGARLPAPRSMRAGKPGRCGGVAISRALRPACA